MNHECPECGDTLTIPDDTIAGEILPCPTCGADLEITSLAPLALQAAPDVDEDWGE